MAKQHAEPQHDRPDHHETDTAAVAANKAKAPRSKPRPTPTAKPEAAKAKSDAKPKLQIGSFNHVLRVEEKNAGTPNACFNLWAADGRMLGSFSTESTINEKFERAGDSRRMKNGKITENGNDHD